jgi:hypothetical protein
MMMIKATYNDKPFVVDILTQAYDSNSSVNYLIRQDNERTLRIKQLVEYAFETCWQSGEVYLSNDRKGAALLLRHDKEQTTVTSLLRDIKFAVSTIGILHLARVMAVEKYKKRTRPKLDNYLYFWWYGVKPGYQGEGAAKELRDEIFALADKRGLPILAETTGEKHSRVYQRWGLTLYHQWTTGQGTITYYFLLRHPQAIR